MYFDRARYARKLNSVKTGNDIRISTSSNTVTFVAVGFVSKRSFQKYRGLQD